MALRTLEPITPDTLKHRENPYIVLDHFNTHSGKRVVVVEHGENLPDELGRPLDILVETDQGIITLHVAEGGLILSVEDERNYALQINQSNWADDCLRLTAPKT